MSSASVRWSRLPRLTAVVAVVLFGCRGAAPVAPRDLGAAGWQVDAQVDASGVAVAGDATYATTGPAVVRLDGGRETWRVAIPAAGGAVAASGDLVAAAIHGTGAIDGLALGLRGDPGAAIVGLAASDGARRWLVGVGATSWARVRAVVAYGDGVAIAGSFAGTLRIGDRVVSSAGDSDGFWAVLDRAGAVQRLARMGGLGADAIAGLAALPDGALAIAGTYAGPAELDDVALPPLYTGDFGDGFVAVVETGGAMRWARSWGNAGGDACAGVVATDDGVAVAATVRGVVDVAGRRVDAHGGADGLVAFFNHTNAVRGTILVGGSDFDGLTAIAGQGDRVVVGGWFSGTLDGPGGALVAAGGDDALLAVVTPDGVAALEAVSSDAAATVRAVATDATTWAAAVSTTGAARYHGRDLAGPAALVGSRW